MICLLLEMTEFYNGTEKKAALGAFLFKDNLEKG